MQVQSWIAKWFITLRDEENLTESQKRYIKRWSFGPILLARPEVNLEQM